MQFATALSLGDPAHFLEMARVADASGWDYLCVSDHVAFPEKLDSAYPYVADGKPFWPIDTPWPDPWVTIGAMAAVTERLRFLTNVYVLPARHPIHVAKAVATAAVLSGNRVSMGIGVGWMREEFEVVGEDFSTRGRRTDEAIEILRALWAGGVAEYHGRFYDFDRLHVHPAPSAPVPIIVGGVSEAALRRAARYGNGWVSVAHGFDELAELIARLQALRTQEGTRDRPFEIIASCNDCVDVDGYRRLEELGVSTLLTVPWIFYGGDPDSLADKCDGLRRFAGDVIATMRG